jgi:hypothetical protein
MQEVTNRQPDVFEDATCAVLYFSTRQMEERTQGLLPPSATHPVLDYLCGQKKEKWDVQFQHPIAEAFKYPATSIFKGNIDWTYLNIFDQSRRKKIFGTIIEPNIEVILSKSTPSCFGRGDETVFDEDVRKGRELTPSQISAQYLPITSSREIQQVLFPHSKKIRCQFSKMAIYEAGGHFDVHRDTVRSHAHQATMLVEVRSAHIGGDLILEPTNGESVRWSLSSVPSDLDNGFVRYIAFYTDVNHRVEPIESGVRIVLQYDIYVDDDDQQDDWEDEDHYNNDFFRMTIPFSSSISNDKLLTLLDEYVTERLSVSFPLLHLYTDTKLLPSRLKSADHQIFTALLDHGFHVQMVPVQITAQSDYEGSFASYATHSIRSLAMTDEGYSLDESGIIIHSQMTLSEILYIATGFEQLVEMGEKSFVEHTGNESAPAEYQYFQSVFVVSRMQPVGETGKRKRGL